jgi:hypothetical protein
MTRITHVRIYVAHRRRNSMQGVSHTIKLTPPDETPEDRGRLAIRKSFVGTDIVEEGITDEI